MNLSVVVVLRPGGLFTRKIDRAETEEMFADLTEQTNDKMRQYGKILEGFFIFILLNGILISKKQK